LYGENFRWRHKGSFGAVFDAITAACSAMMVLPLRRHPGETIHGGRFFQIRGDFGKNALLCRRGLNGRMRFSASRMASSRTRKAMAFSLRAPCAPKRAELVEENSSK